MYSLCIITFTALSVLCVDADNNSQVMSKLSVNFGNQLYECSGKVAINDDLIGLYLNFWNESQPLVEKQLGCAVRCVLRNLNLMDGRGRMVEPSAASFLIESGAGDDMIVKMLELCDTCRNETAAKNITDTCTTILEFTKCFRCGIFKLGWVPDSAQFIKTSHELRRFIENNAQIANLKTDQFLNDNVEIIKIPCRRNIPVDLKINTATDKIYRIKQQVKKLTIQSTMKEKKNPVSGSRKEPFLVSNRPEQIAVSIVYDDPPHSNKRSVNNDNITPIIDKANVITTVPEEVDSKTNQPEARLLITTPKISRLFNENMTKIPTNAEASTTAAKTSDKI